MAISNDMKLAQFEMASSDKSDDDHLRTHDNNKFAAGNV
jgi:hypothetical protein